MLLIRPVSVGLFVAMALTHALHPRQPRVLASASGSAGLDRPVWDAAMSPLRDHHVVLHVVGDFAPFAFAQLVVQRSVLSLIHI